MTQTLRIGVIGDWDPDKPSHTATNQGLAHAATVLSRDLACRWLPTEGLMVENLSSCLEDSDGLWCAPGSPYNSMDGAIRAIRFARENDWPFIGT